MGAIGQTKTGGRQKGAIGRRFEHGPNAIKLANELGVDPFEILLRFAANDWSGLGYEDGNQIIFSALGAEIKIDKISVADRINAAKDACTYLYPKRSALKIEDSEGKGLAESLTALFKSVSDGK